MQKKIVSETRLEVSTVHDVHEFENLRDDWCILFAESKCNEMFLSWEWLFAWWTYHQAGKELWIVTVRQSGRLVGIVPFMLVLVEKCKLKFRVLTHLGMPDSDISGCIICENTNGVIEAICDHLFSQHKKWDLLNVHNLYVHDAKVQTLLRSMKKRRSSVLNYVESHLYLPIRTEWDDYFEKLPHPLTGYLHHHIDRAKKKGDIRFETHTGKDLTVEHFETIFEIGKKSRYAYLYEPENEYEFFKKLLALTHGEGLEIDILYLNDKPVSFNFGFNLANRHEGWRRAYDQDYCKVGVGKIMSKYMTQSFFERKFKEFDFLRGLEEYKREWMPLEREFIEIKVIPNQKLMAVIVFLWLPRLKAWGRLGIDRLIAGYRIFRTGKVISGQNA